MRRRYSGLPSSWHGFPSAKHRPSKVESARHQLFDRYRVNQRKSFAISSATFELLAGTGLVVVRLLTTPYPVQWHRGVYYSGRKQHRLRVTLRYHVVQLILPGDKVAFVVVLHPVKVIRIQGLRYRRMVTKSRYLKFMAFEYFQNHGMSYELIAYCDGFMSPRTNIDWLGMSKHFRSDRLRLIQSAHNNKLDRELKDIVARKKDSATSIARTKKYICGINPTYLGRRIYDNIAFIYDPRDKNLQRVFRELWRVYSCERYTFRDQPLWALTLFRQRKQPVVMGQRLHNTNRSIKDRFFQSSGRRGFNNHQYV